MALVSVEERAKWFGAMKGMVLSSAMTQFLELIQPWVESAIAQVLGYNLEQATYTEYCPASGSERPPLEFGIDVGWDLIGGVVAPRTRGDPTMGVLQLKNLPVRSVTSVNENLSAWSKGVTDGDWPAASLLPVQAYRLDQPENGYCMNGRLIRVVGSWTTIPRTVRVVYVGGYTAGELDGRYAQVKLACLLSLGWWWSKAMQSSQAVKGGGAIALQVAIRDFSVTLGNPSALGATPGTWVHNILPPEAMNILSQFVNMAKYF